MSGVETQIATELSSLMSDYYGHGPTNARAIMAEDVVIVILEETFSPAERTLIRHGEVEEIQRIRRRFQRIMAEDFRSVVEANTGREVRAFTSDTDVSADVSVEAFILGEPKTDMDTFEDDSQEEDLRDPPAPESNDR